MEMPETGYSLERHVEGESRHLDAPLLRHDLGAAAEELRRTPAMHSTGHCAKTLAKYRNLRVVLVALQGGARMGEHRAPGQLTLQTLTGQVRLELSERTVVVHAGELVTLEEPWPHDVEAVEDSVVLLTLWWPGRQRKGPRR
jgi:quercetin dioxygenase-like cupin family protein